MHCMVNKGKPVKMQVPSQRVKLSQTRKMRGPHNATRECAARYPQETQRDES